MHVVKGGDERVSSLVAFDFFVVAGTRAGDSPAGSGTTSASISFFFDDDVVDDDDDTGIDEEVLVM